MPLFRGTRSIRPLSEGERAGDWMRSPHMQRPRWHLRADQQETVCGRACRPPLEHRTRLAEGDRHCEDCRRRRARFEQLPGTSAYAKGMRQEQRRLDNAQRAKEGERERGQRIEERRRQGAYDRPAGADKPVE